MCEPSLALFQDKYYLTLRNDARAYVTTSTDGLHFAPVKPWIFDDGQDLGSYNTQAYWLAHSDGLFLAYTRGPVVLYTVNEKRAALAARSLAAERLSHQRHVAGRYFAVIVVPVLQSHAVIAEPAPPARVGV